MKKGQARCEPGLKRANDLDKVVAVVRVGMVGLPPLTHDRDIDLSD
jgi:hypothetical protein